MSSDWPFLEHLVQSAVLTARQLADALAERRRTRSTLRDALGRLGLLDDTSFTRLWVAFHDLPQPALATLVPSEAALAAISRDLCLRYTALPLELTTDQATVVMADPSHTSRGGCAPLRGWARRLSSVRRIRSSSALSSAE